MLDSEGDPRGQSPSRGRVGLTSGCPPAPPAPPAPSGRPTAPPAPDLDKRHWGGNLGVNTAFALLGSILNGLFYWAIFSLCLRLSGTAAAGSLALGLGITSPLMIFAQLGLRQHYVVHQDSRYTLYDYASLRTVTTLIALVLAITVGIIFYSPVTTLLIAAIGLMKTAENGSDLVYAVHQRSRRQDKIAYSLLLRSTTGMGAMLIGLSLWNSQAYAVFGVAICWFTLLTVVDLKAAKTFYRSSINTTGESQLSRSTWQKGRTLARESAPLAMALLTASLIANVPRLYLERTLGANALGEFAAVAYFVVPGSMLMGALGQACVPELAQAFSEGNRTQFNRTLWHMLAVALVLGACGIALSLGFSSKLVHLAYGSTNASIADLLPLAMVIALVTNILAALSYGLTATASFLPQTKIQLYTLVLIGVAVIPCTTLLGLRGALLAWLIAVVCQTFAMAKAISDRQQCMHVIK